jgi:DNA-directed RNA polymerase I subunit RPA1
MTLAKNGLIEQLPLVDDLYKKILSNTDAKLISRVSFRKDFEDLLIQIMSEHREELRGEVNHDSYRNVIRSKIDILKEFMDHKLKASRQTCPNCMLPLRQLRAEHNSKLFYAKGVSARALKKNKLSHVSVKFTKQNEEEQIPVDEMDQLDIQLDSVVLDTANSKTLKNNRKANDISLNDELEQSEDEEEKLENLTGQTYLTPIEARKFLQMLFDNDKETIQLMFSLPRSQEKNDTELFFFDSIAVPPSKYRPVSQFKEQRFENSQTSQLSKLLQQNIILKDILNEIISATKETIIEDSIVSLNKLGKRAPSLQEKLQSSWLQMQSILNVLYDSGKLILC